MKNIAGFQFRNTVSFVAVPILAFIRQYITLPFLNFLLFFFREENFKTEVERLRKELENADEKQRNATETKVYILLCLQQERLELLGNHFSYSCSLRPEYC